MRIMHTGKVLRIYKDAINLWCIDVRRTESGVKGVDTYIKIMPKPKLKVGQKVTAGDTI